MNTSGSTNERVSDARLAEILTARWSDGEHAHGSEIEACLLELQRLRLALEPAVNAVDKGWGDRLLELSDGSNFGTLEELQEELIAIADDLHTGAQSVSDWARQPETKAEK